MDKSKERAIEHQKYKDAYCQPRYAMGSKRSRDARHDLAMSDCRDSFLDVSCGRGEMLQYAAQIGFNKVQGTEIVPDLIDGTRVVYAEVHELPFSDNEFEVVSMNDVIEHLLPGDDRLACLELARVSSVDIFLTANNQVAKTPSGKDLHINIRTYAEWHNLFCEWFEGWNVERINGNNSFSARWHIYAN